MQRGCVRLEPLEDVLRHNGGSATEGSEGSSGRVWVRDVSCSDAMDDTVVSESATPVCIMDRFECTPLVIVECVDGDVAVCIVYS